MEYLSARKLQKSGTYQDVEFRYFAKKAEYKELLSLVTYGSYPKMQKNPQTNVRLGISQ